MLTQQVIHGDCKAVLRTAPSESLLAGIHERFGSIVHDGKFVVGGPLAEEQDEPALEKLPRLILRFNRRNLGRLRQLIDCLNRGRLEPPTEAGAPVDGRR